MNSCSQDQLRRIATMPTPSQTAAQIIGEIPRFIRTYLRVHGRTDTVAGVSECIIMGQSVPLGSGLFKLLRAAEQPAAPSPPDLLLS